MGKKVLVAPLNWGLGHATRCVPIVRLLLQRGHEVFIASDGDSLMLLKKEFPALAFFELPSYNIQYSRNIPAWLFTLWRTPQFLKSIRLEHAVVEKLIHENSIELIISDNRYGCRSKKVQSVFMSHQLNLIMPSGMKWMGGTINFFHRMLIRKFSTIWVPDAQKSVLSGDLSRSNLSVEFIGVLSRFEKSIEIQQVNKLVVVLSGPEPQRTLLEKNLLPQVIALNLPSIFVRGLLNEKMGESEIDQVKIVNYLKSDTLQNVMEQSEIIISRSGYSTIMDLAVLKKKAILIPTPGQPEQEYLASKYMNDRIAYSTDQEVLDLADALELSTEYLGFEHKASDELLLKAFDKVGL
jgi:UDP:flavonoid glycosyltransferase YjiC (YdhE family)